MIQTQCTKVRKLTILKLSFEAVGPMYDVDANRNGDSTDSGDIDSVISIIIPDGLSTPDDVDETAEGFIEVSHAPGVEFEDPNDPIDVADQVVTIKIKKIDRGEKIYIDYKKVTVSPTLSAAQRFSARTNTEAPANLTELQKVDGTVISIDGQAHTIAGSGEMTVMDEIVEVGSRETLTFTYTAKTELVDATLTIARPDVSGVDPPWGEVMLTQESLTDGVASDNYVQGPRTLPEGVELEINTDGDLITWTKLDLGAGDTFKTTIANVDIPGTSDEYSWGTKVWTGEAEPGGDVAELPAAPTLFVVKKADAVDFEILQADNDMTERFPRYHAASEQPIGFKFTATDTPIKDGSVWFEIPSTWTRPSLSDVEGRATVRLVENPASAPDDNTNPETLVEKIGDNTLSVSSYEITVDIKTLAKEGFITIQYGTADFPAAVQDSAEDGVEIIGYFDSGLGSSNRAGAVQVEIANADDGSGTATIKTMPRPYDSVNAGSTDNTIEVTFEAEGTMDGGKVRLELPLNGWGTIQELKSEEANYIQIQAPDGAVDEDRIDYGDKVVVANLVEFGAGDTLTFILTNAVAQTALGVADFTIKSAGSRSGNLMELEGEERPEDVTDLYDLLGKVYASSTSDMSAGLLRIAVIGGDDGTGTAEVKIVRSNEGLKKYDGEPGTIRQVHAGDNEIYLKFTYTPVETIENGELVFTVPTQFGWSKPQRDSARTMGYTDVRRVGTARLGTESFGTDSVTIPIFSIDKDDKIEIHYGVENGGAEAPKIVIEKSTFTIEVQGSATGDPEPIDDQPFVRVRSQASGRGSASIDKETVSAGDTDTIKITYTSIGQIVNGRVKLTVPDTWAGGEGAKDAHFDVSSGSVTYGGDMTETEVEANEDIGSKHEVLVEGVNLSAEQTLTFTYNAMVPLTTGDVTFTVALDGGAGPDMDIKKVMDLTVAVGGAEAGSGMVAVMPDGVTASSPGNEIVFTYTAIGVIGEEREFSVTVPEGWSPPLNEAAADDKMGTYTVTHTLKDGSAGSAVEALDPEKVAETDMDARIMVAQVKVGATVNEGDMIVFTYTNAMAPETLGSSMFEMSFDDMPVEGDLSVLVQLAMPVVTASASLEIAANGDEVTITAESSESDLSVSANVSALDSMQTEMILLEETDGTGTYIGSFTISMENESEDGPQAIIVTATNAIGNSGTPEDAVTVTLDNTAPVVTASASLATAANDDEVTITATVEDAGEVSSVMADVSMLDSTRMENPVELIRWKMVPTAVRSLSAWRTNRRTVPKRLP